MIEYVKELGAELEIQSLGKLRIFGYGEIKVPESRAIHSVAAEIAEVAGRQGKGKRVDVAVRRIAADRIWLTPGTTSGR